MRRLVILVSLLALSGAGCWVLRGGKDQCDLGPDRCDGNAIVRCSSMKESYNRLTREDCPEGNVCVERTAGSPECGPG